MPNTLQTIEQLKDERNKHLTEIERIDRVLAAYYLLVEERILPGSDNDDEKSLKIKQALKGNGLFVGPKRSIREFIEQYRKKIFTVPEVVQFTNINRRRVKLEINKMIANGELKVITEGKKGRAGKYKLIESI